MVKKLLIQFFIPVLFLIFIYLCVRYTALAEWYMCCVYPSVAAFLSFFSRLTPYSLLDVFVFFAVSLFLVGTVMVCIRRMKFGFWIRTLALSVLWVVVWFYMSWGISYFRMGFHERFNVKQPKEDREFFEAFVQKYIDLLNRSYIPNPYFDAKEIDEELEKVYAEHHETIRLPYPCGWRRTKRNITGPFMRRMGISGYFGPFFNEVHVNRYGLPITYPYTLAHEKAHQFGIASEAECNLYATIICISSVHSLVRYSGYLQTVSYLLGNLRKISPDKYRDIVGTIKPEIIADYRAIQEYWQKEANQTMATAQDKVYNAYLKTNRQRSGVLSYSEMTGLLIVWDGMVD